MVLCSHCLGFGLSFQATSDIILDIIYSRYCTVKVRNHLIVPQLTVLMRAHEVHSGVGLGSGAVHITEPD